MSEPDLQVERRRWAHLKRDGEDLPTPEAPEVPVVPPEIPAAPPDTPRLVRSSLGVASGTALSRITGLLRLVVLADVIGRGTISDAYLLANNTPNIVYELILGGILSATLLPLFVEAADRDDDEGPSAVVSTSLVAMMLLALLATLAVPVIVRLYALRLPESTAQDQIDLASVLLFIFLPQIVFYGLTAMWTALLNARRRFLAAAYAPVLNNLVVIAALLVFDTRASGRDISVSGVLDDGQLLALIGGGTTGGVVVMTLALWWPLRRSGWRLRWHPDWRHPMVRAVLRLSGWTMGYVAANQVALFVILALANASAGDVTAYAFAFIFFQLPHGLVAVSVMTTFSPELASAAGRRDWDRFRDRFATGSQVITGLLLPAAVGYILLGEGLVRALLEHGEFVQTDSLATAQVLEWFAVGLLGFSLYLFALRGFYAMRDTRTPFFLNLFENGVNIVLAVALVGRYGVEGLAAAYAVAYTVAAAAALVALRRRTGGLGGRRLVAGFVRIAAATLVMALVVAVLTGGFASSASVGAGELVGAVAVGVAVYAMALGVLWGPTTVRRVAARLGRRIT
ncbi:MAG: murein biosynthesis integral membrane protein MurJ [Acidimicrobiales bacterium]